MSTAHLVELYAVAGEGHGAGKVGLFPGEELGGRTVVGALHLAGVLLGVYRQDGGLLGHWRTKIHCLFRRVRFFTLP